MNGSCSDPVTGNTNSGSSSGSGSGGTFSIDGGINISNAASTTSPSSGNGTSGGQGGSGNARPASETTGCSCRVAGPSSGSASLALLGLAASVIAARRRRVA